MYYFLWGCASLIIGVLNLRFDFDTFTYIWFISGIFWVIVGYIKALVIAKPK
jgi:uncharacterized membrane protein HdeD (DUF308 family)